jgi:hypothetical protein
VADRGRVHDAIHRWESSGLIDAATAERLRSEEADHARSGARRMSQYVLAITGAVVLLIAGGVFMDWAWPLMGDRSRTLVLAAVGTIALLVGLSMETARRWVPASLLIQTSGVVLVLSAYAYSERAWADLTPGGFIVGLAALVTPIALTAHAMRRSPFMPAVHMAAGLAFLALFLDRATPLSGDAIVWTLDGVLAASIAVLMGVLRGDPDGDRHPWALNAFVTAMGAGFVLVAFTAFETLSLSDEGFLPLDVWLLFSVALTLWGLHRAPAGLRRDWFERLLAWEVLGWIGLGLATAAETFDGPPELGVLMVGGAGVLAFLHADRHGMGTVMGAAALAFIVPLWWWAVERGGALGGVFALVATAALLFFASGRRGEAGGGAEE